MCVPSAANEDADVEAHLANLRTALMQRRALLFVGAGASMSVGMPSWSALIEHMLEELDLDPSILASPDITYQTIAEYFRLRHGGLETLGEWMKQRWFVSDDQIRASSLHKLIVDLDFPTIYTTNYDANLEAAYRIYRRPYHKVTNVRDLAQASTECTMIIKYHGDFDDVGSLVIAETDYFDRLTFEAPLDLRFRSDALTATMLFIGYSMSDLNIRVLLHRLWRMWGQTRSPSDRPRSYVYMHQPGEVQRTVLNKWGVTVLSSSAGDPEASLVGFLEKLSSSLKH